MTLEEQAAYLQQIKETAKLNPQDAKEQLLRELTDTVSLLCHQVSSMGVVVDGLNESLDVIQQTLEEFSEYEMEEDEDGNTLGVDEYYDGKEHPLYEVKCPQCGDRFAVDEQTLAKGFSCPTCGEHLVQAE